MFNAFFAAPTFTDIGILAIAIWVGKEILALTYAFLRTLMAPAGFAISAFCATFLWNSLVFSDAWKQYKKVPNIPVTSAALFLGMSIFLGLGYFEYGSMLEAVGLSALCAVCFTGSAHLTLLYASSTYQAKHAKAKEVQNRLEFGA
jgi:hypothetical protein